MITSLDNTHPINVRNPEHQVYLHVLLTLHDQLMLELCAYALVHGPERLNRGTWHPALTN